MTNKELIQTLRCRDSGDCFKCGLMVVCGNLNAQAADRLEALLAENERLKAGKDTDAPTKWVSVEERLPEMHTEQIHDSDGAVYSFAVSDRVLVKPRNGEIAIAQYEVSDEGRVMWEDDSGRAFEVTHWMPLPSTEGVE